MPLARPPSLALHHAAVNAGEVLPNINDGFAGKAPDLDLDLDLT